MSEQDVHEAASAPDRTSVPRTGQHDLRQRLLHVLLTPEEGPQMSYEAFLAWADEDTLAEWVAGEVVMTSPASRQHQEISLFLGTIISLYGEQRGLGKTILPPFQMKLGDSGREPDLLWLSQAHLDRLKETHLDGPADLVVEIVSPESIGRDRGDKFYEYERAGILEYWLIDPQTRRTEFYQLDERGQYQLVPPDAEGVYRSAVLSGFWLRVGWLWQPPRVLDVLRELSLI